MIMVIILEYTYYISITHCIKSEVHKPVRIFYLHNNLLTLRESRKNKVA